MKVDSNYSNIFVRSIRQVFRNPLYDLLAFSIAVIVLITAIWLPNLHLVTKTIHSTNLSFLQKGNILTGLLGGIETNFTPLSRSLTILTSILFGINVAIITYYFRRRFSLEKEAGVSLGGMLFGLLGVGCTSCGSVILATLLGLSVSASILGFLPLKGQEFGLLGVILLVIAITITAKKIADPLNCKVAK